jgi:hypothetical protein
MASAADPHSTELIETAYSLIEDAIDKLKDNKVIDLARRSMFEIEKKPEKGPRVKQLNLAVSMPGPSGFKKNFSLNVECGSNVMLLLKVNYWVLHALALIAMAGRGEPVDAFVDQFNDYNDEKEADEVSGKYCSGASKRVKTTGGGGGVRGGEKGKAKAKTAPKAKSVPKKKSAKAAPLPKNKNKNKVAPKK